MYKGSNKLGARGRVRKSRYVPFAEARGGGLLPQSPVGKVSAEDFIIKEKPRESDPHNPIVHHPTRFNGRYSGAT